MRRPSDRRRDPARTVHRQNDRYRGRRRRWSWDHVCWLSCRLRRDVRHAGWCRRDRRVAGCADGAGFDVAFAAPSEHDRGCDNDQQYRHRGRHAQPSRGRLPRRVCYFPRDEERTGRCFSRELLKKLANHALVIQIEFVCVSSDEPPGKRLRRESRSIVAFNGRQRSCGHTRALGQRADRESFGFASGSKFCPMSMIVPCWHLVL